MYDISSLRVKLWSFHQRCFSGTQVGPVVWPKIAVPVNNLRMAVS